MYNNGYYIEEVDLSGLNTSNVTTMSYMFANCYKLKKIDLSILDMSKIGMNGTRHFCDNCYELETIIFPNNLPNISRVIRDTCLKCYSLKTFVLPGSYVYGYETIFTDCYHLTGTYDATYNPDSLKDGYIYVPDNLVNSYKSASGWSDYSTQIKGLSEIPNDI